MYVLGIPNQLPIRQRVLWYLKMKIRLLFRISSQVIEKRMNYQQERLISIMTINNKTQMIRA